MNEVKARKKGARPVPHTSGRKFQVPEEKKEVEKLGREEAEKLGSWEAEKKKRKK